MFYFNRNTFYDVGIVSSLDGHIFLYIVWIVSSVRENIRRLTLEDKTRMSLIFSHIHLNTYIFEFFEGVLASVKLVHSEKY